MVDNNPKIPSSLPPLSNTTQETFENKAIVDSIEALEQILAKHDQGFESREREWDEIEQAERNLEERDAFVENIMDNIETFLDLDPNEQEKLTDNNRELMYRFPKDKVIVKEDGKSYLIDREKKLDQLSSEEKTNAHQAYKTLKSDFKSLQEKIKTSHQENKNQHIKRKQNFLDRSSHIHQEITFLTQQLADLQTTRYALQHQLKPSTQQQITPEEQEKKQPRPPPKTPQQAPQPKHQVPPTSKPEFNIATFERSFAHLLRINPRAAIEAQDRTAAPRFLQQTEFGMPLEQRTIESLIKQRSGRAGALANDLLTNPKALAAQRDEARFNPDAEPSPKNQAKDALKAALEANMTPKVERTNTDDVEQKKPILLSPLSTTPKPKPHQ